MGKRINHTDYEEKLKKINPNIRALEEYVNNKKKILHSCKVCEFQWEARPNDILAGRGCPKCGGNIKKNHDEYVEELSKINLSIEIIDRYINAVTPVKHRCKECGHEWMVRPNNVLAGVKCPNKCNGDIKKEVLDIKKEEKVTKVQVPKEENKETRLLTNDPETGMKFLTTIKKELLECDEFFFSVAFATKGGVACVIEDLKELKENKINGKILVSQYQDFTQPEALRTLLKFDNIDLRIESNSNFHAKGYFFKKENKQIFIVGSSNLTNSALCKHKEWNLMVSTDDGSRLSNEVMEEANKNFDKATRVSKKFIDEYEEVYKRLQKVHCEAKKLYKEPVEKIEPNRMQKEALENLKNLREEGKDKALLISATATGKTYLSAFDVKNKGAEKVLFIVHRTNITKKAMESYKKIFGERLKAGIYAGSEKNKDADFIFTNISTISLNKNLSKFDSDHFDYIVIDETHRSEAKSYQKVLNHFKPDFLLGMTATPERTDGINVCKNFDYNIAYEIRLKKALEEEMLAPFHYYGVADLQINDEVIKDKTKFNRLVSDERVDKIIENSELYGCDNGLIRGLIFCSSIDECIELSKKFDNRGLKTIYLDAKSKEKEREAAIERLESDDLEQKLDYIFTVDLFNEGVDIPKVNQIIMLRPTQSAIIFVQQLGRGLRKAENKKYLTVIDFIGNYENNYLIPIALYGNSSYSKDKIRKDIISGSNGIPGNSTINFDKVSRERIFDSLDRKNLNLKSDLVRDYKLLKHKIGRVPAMCDFLDMGYRDPFSFVSYSGSYFNFVKSQEKEIDGILEEKDVKLLEFFSKEIANGKRVGEVILMKELLKGKKVGFRELKDKINERYGYEVSNETLDSIAINLNFEFIREKSGGKLLSLNEIYNIDVVEVSDETFILKEEFKNILAKKIFNEYLEDLVEYAIKKYNYSFKIDNYNEGFIKYEKYSRKDVFRILNWKENPVAQNVGGYMVQKEDLNCPIFINYHKEEDISATTKYEDYFIDQKTFHWMSKSNRTINSPDVKSILSEGIRLPLFVKKNNDEGRDFYYIGDVKPVDSEQSEIAGKNVVKITFELDESVDKEIYGYLNSVVKVKK